jgi:hypothetical protein
MQSTDDNESAIDRYFLQIIQQFSMIEKGKGEGDISEA